MYQGIGPVTLKPLINFSIIKSETTWHYMLHDIKVCIIIYKVFLPKTNKPKNPQRIYHQPFRYLTTTLQEIRIIEKQVK